MIACLQCGNNNPESVGFCESCGAELEHALYRVCPACGALNATGRTTCNRCLASLDAPLVGPVDARHEGEDADAGAYASALDDTLAGLEGLLPAVEILDPVSGAAHHGADDARPDARKRDASELNASEHNASEYHASERHASERHASERNESELLHRIATEPAPLGRMRQEGAPVGPEHMPGGLRRLLYLLVLLAALAPLFTGDLSRSWESPRPQVALLAEDIASIPTGGRVLVAFDYAPGYGGELDPLAERVLIDLARRGISLVAVSTRPEGVGLARQVLARSASFAPDYRYGADYVILGYLPGAERGLRLVTQDLAVILPHDDVLQLSWEQLPALQGIETAADFVAIVLLTDDGSSARRWIEQVSAQVETPTYALATARIEPLLIPYLQSGQLAALTAGVYGALEYPLADAPESNNLHSTDSYLALLGVFVLTALLANLVPWRVTKG